MSIRTRIKWSAGRFAAIARMHEIANDADRTERVEARVKGLRPDFRMPGFGLRIRAHKRMIRMYDSRRFGWWYCLFGFPFPITSEVC